MQIYHRFREIRKILKMTQTEFGKQLGKTMRAIQNYESGERNINNDIIMILNEKFNVNIHWLYTGTGSMFLEEKKDDSKYKWLINTLDKLSDDDIKKVEQEAQKILEEQYNKEMNINPTKRIG